MKGLILTLGLLTPFQTVFATVNTTEAGPATWSFSVLPTLNCNINQAEQTFSSSVTPIGCTPINVGSAQTFSITLNQPNCGCKLVSLPLSRATDWPLQLVELFTSNKYALQWRFSPLIAIWKAWLTSNWFSSCDASTAYVSTTAGCTTTALTIGKITCRSWTRCWMLRETPVFRVFQIFELLKHEGCIFEATELIWMVLGKL